MKRQAVAKVEKMRTGNDRLHRQSARSSSAGHPLLELQRSVGNQAIQRLAGSPFIQAKLQISAPEDESEQEADRVADNVMRMPEPAVSRTDEEDKIVAPKSKSRIPLAVRDDDEEEKPLVHRACTECEEEKKLDQGQTGAMVQRKSAPAQPSDDDDLEEQQVQPKGAQTSTPKVTSSVAANIQAMNGGGSSLPATTRAFFEPRFGADLSQVRVHTDSRATATARSINARAFTVGRNIAFGSGQYVPHSYEGRQLLAHELTHLMQQSANRDVVHRQPENVIFRDTTAQERQEQKRDAWLKELGNYPPDAHQEWKRLTNMEKTAVVIQMTKRYGYDFAKNFLAYTKGPNKSSTQHFGPGFPEHTPDWFQARGYRLWQRSSFNEFWVHPSGSMIMQILDQKRSPQTAEDRPPRDAPIEDCSAVADATLSILRDTTSTETSVKEDLEGTKGRLEKMDKTTDDYCQQYDEYIQSLQTMKARVDSTVDDIDTMRQQLVEDKCSVSNIDGLLQDLTDLQIWADIESSPMSTQFLQCLKIRGPKESTEEE